MDIKGLLFKLINIRITSHSSINTLTFLRMKANNTPPHIHAHTTFLSTIIMAITRKTFLCIYCYLVNINNYMLKAFLLKTIIIVNN